MSDKICKVGILTLGCKVNQYESEAIAERCTSLGLECCSPDEVCDIYIVNTCTVTAEADRKCRQMIRQLGRRNPEAEIIVTGCMSQRNPEAAASLPGVSYVCGNREKLSCALAAADFSRGGSAYLGKCSVGSLEEAGFECMSISAFPRTRQYIKIEDGCENHCAYCAICDARGPVRSKTVEAVIKEAVRFAESGCREIVLTGIETSSFGRDTGENLGELLAALDREIHGVRVRLGSVDPTLFRPAFLDKIAGLDCICPHFHISMQSGSSAVLARMRRPYNAGQAHSAFAAIRAAIPGVMFTTDIITGFPGETEEDFELTCSFVSDEKFLMTHVFPFSPRKGTEAYSMSGQLNEEIKHRRTLKLIDIAAQTRSSILDSLTGTRQEVLFETGENGIWTGHTPSFVEVSVASDMPLHGLVKNVIIKSHTDSGCFAETESDTRGN